jgi:hypothetical protein
MTTRPGYVWDNTANEWVEIGQAAVIAPVSYQATEPTSPSTGDIWIDSDDEVPGITSSLNYRWRKIATGGETSLSGNDSSGLPLAYNPGYEQVYLNGVLLYRGSDYVATTGNTITGLTALVANDTIEVLSFVTAPIGDTYTQAAADGKFVSKTVNGMSLMIPTLSGITGAATVSTNGQITLTNATALTINNCFTSEFQNYLFVYSLTGNIGADIAARVTASGTELNTVSYTQQLMTYSGTTLAGAQDTSVSSIGRFGVVRPSIPVTGTAKIYNPSRSSYTSFDMDMVDAVSTITIRKNVALVTNTSIYDGLRLTSASTLTGTIRIYGLNDGA